MASTTAPAGPPVLCDIGPLRLQTPRARPRLEGVRAVVLPHEPRLLGDMAQRQEGRERGDVKQGGRAPQRRSEDAVRQRPGDHPPGPDGAALQDAVPAPEVQDRRHGPEDNSLDIYTNNIGVVVIMEEDGETTTSAPTPG